MKNIKYELNDINILQVVRCHIPIGENSIPIDIQFLKRSTHFVIVLLPTDLSSKHLSLKET